MVSHLHPPPPLPLFPVTTYPLFASTIKTGVGCHGKMYWSIPSSTSLSTYDVTPHVKERTLSVPGWGVPGSDDSEIDATNSNALDKALRSYVGDELMDKSFDLTRGMFEVYVVKYKGEGGEIGRCDLVWRLHHAIGDGVLLSKVLENLCEKSAVAKGDEVKKKVDGSKKKRVKKKISTLTLVKNAVGCTVRTLMLPLSFHDVRTHLKAPSTPGSLPPSKVYGSSSVWKVEDAKEAGRQFGGTVNDVVTAAISKAMREYNLSKSCGVTRRGGKKLKVRALAVVNTRTMREETSAVEQFKRCEATNEFSYVVPRLPLGEMGVRERVEICRDEVRARKGGEGGDYCLAKFNRLVTPYTDTPSPFPI